MLLSAEVPVLWVRVDPEMQWLRSLQPTLPDTVWINILQYERDAIAQLEVKHVVHKIHNYVFEGY